MKFHYSLGFLFAVSGVASAIPVADISPDLDLVPRELVEYGSNEVEVRSLNEANVLKARINCRKINRTIVRIGTSAAVSAIIHLSTDLAKQVCEGEGAPKCAKYVGYVQSGLDIIFLAIGYAHGSVGTSSTNEQSSFNPGPVRRDISTEKSFADGLNDVLQNDGWKYDLLENVDVSSLNVGKRDSDPKLIHRSIARNMKYDDQGNTSDVGFNYYDNGDINLDFAGDFGTLPTSSGQSNVQKRFSGAGFKISTTTRVQSRLTRPHEKSMAHSIAMDWASDANSYAMSDYIGLVKTGHTANFYFRIIPETKGFGLNYESVNICGQLSGYL